MSIVTSSTEIVNLALDRLGVESIDSLSGDSKRAKIMNRMYPVVRNSVLEAAPWNFAMGRKKLTKLAAAPEFEYQSQFSLPADHLRAWQVFDSDPSGSGGSGVKHPGVHLNIDGEIEYKIEGDKLLSNTKNIYLLYIKEVTDVSLYTASFVKALYTRLAAEASYSIIQNTTEKNSLLQESELYIQQASTNSSQEDTPEDIELDWFINPRFT